jgi:hypothetical protein
MARMFNPPHPGLTLRDDVLPALVLNVTQAAQQLGVNRVTLSRVSSSVVGTCPKLPEAAQNGQVQSLRFRWASHSAMSAFTSACSSVGTKQARSSEIPALARFSRDFLARSLCVMGRSPSGLRGMTPFCHCVTLDNVTLYAT